MKTNAIIRIVIWSIVIVILVGLLATVLLGVQTFRLIRNNTAAILIEDDGLPIASDFTTEVTTGAVKASEVKKIAIEWAAGDITIRPKEGIDQINIYEDLVHNEKYRMVYRLSGNKLTIRFCEQETIHFGIGINTNISKSLLIEVPANWICEELELDVAAANLKIQDLTIREVDFDGASGTCDFTNCKIENLDIDTASGDVTLSGTLDTLDFDAASASFYGTFTNVPYRIDMDGMSGDLDISLPEDCGYNVSIDGLSCTFHSDFQNTEHRDGRHIYGNGECRITVDGMSCDVNIRKNDTVSFPEVTTPVTQTEPEATTDQ